VRLLVNSVVTALGLAVLIAVILPASGAHFNPVVTASTCQPSARSGMPSAGASSCWTG
jgi:glycerol uptake facilitator-like aquaporin